MRALRYIISGLGYTFLIAAIFLFICSINVDAEYSSFMQLLNGVIASLLFGVAGGFSLWFENLLREADEEWYARHPEDRK